MLFPGSGDDELARAAAYHAVRDLDLLRTILDTPVSPVITILEWWRKLRELDFRVGGVATHLARNVLPLLPDVRAAVFLVEEALDELDPSCAIGNFTNRSHANPTEIPLIDTGALPLGQNSAIEAAGFMRSVVATTAHYLGLWAQKNRAENIAFYFEDRARLQAIASFISDPVSANETQRRADAVAAVFDESRKVKINWERHHAASLDRKLRGIKPEHWIQKLSACGMVTVVCDSELECYSALYDLHGALHHRTLNISDSIGQPGVSGYEAIHTLVDLKDNKTARVRIIPQSKNDRRFAPLDREQLANVRHVLETRKPATFQVFAYDGRPFLLPRGATVLNFCLAIHSQIAKFATGAIVGSVAAWFWPWTIGGCESASVVRILCSQRDGSLTR